MEVMAVAAEAIQKDFDRYLADAQDYGEILITENGKPLARLISQEKVNSILTERIMRTLRQKYGTPAAKIPEDSITEKTANERID